ncbi:MAG: hypothetical protein ACRCTL_19020 [Pseudomonas sp.]
MDNLQISIIIGVISGLATSAIGLVIRSLWINSIKPAYENTIYRDAKIEGKWHGIMVFEYDDNLDEHKNSGTNEYIMEVYRQGHSISGMFLGTSGGDEGRVFDISGSFRNLIFTTIFESKNKQCIERGTLNLMLKSNGSRLEGFYTNYEDDTHSIFAQKIVFSRNNA